jgi:hypothetical protein
MEDKEIQKFPDELNFVAKVAGEIANDNYNSAIDQFFEGLKNITVSPDGITADQFQYVFRILEAVVKYKLDLLPKPEDPGPHCSFCGKSESQVARLIAGSAVFICDACVNICSDILSKADPSAADDVETV